MATSLMSCGFGYVWAWFNKDGERARTIAVSLGDATRWNAEAFYGARVFYEPAVKGGGVDVFLEVEIGPESNYIHIPREIGHEKSVNEARTKWRKIEWTPEALVVGEGPNRYSMPRVELERHR